MDQQCYCAGKLSGTRSAEPQIVCAPAKFHGFIATATDGNSTISIWGSTEDDARARVECLWHGIV